MNNWKWFLSVFLFSASVVLANSVFASSYKEKPQSNTYKPQGWSVDVGGGYTWMSFSTPPTYSGSTGGILGKALLSATQGLLWPGTFYLQSRTIIELKK